MLGTREGDRRVSSLPSLIDAAVLMLRGWRRREQAVRGLVLRSLSSIVRVWLDLHERLLLYELQEVMR
jgi:hypothetical protein